MKPSVRFSILASVLGLALLGLGTAESGCGSSSSSGSGGSSTGGKATGGSASGGSNNTGGSNSNTGGSNANTGGSNSNTGGSNANTGGSNNTGGDNSATGGGSAATGGSAACTLGTAPSAPLITDFSAASVVSNVVSAGSIGKVYPFPTTGGPTLSLSGTSPSFAMTVKASVPVGDKYWGASLSFDKCIDASAYTGVTFTLSSVSLAGCELRFGVDIAEDVDPVQNQNPKGTCTKTPCYGPAFALPASATGVTKVAFTDVSYGSPVADVNKKTILGIAWTLHSPVAGDGGADCTNATFTVDDVSFY